jgi:amino-acid N-acetyltransferase
VAAGPPARFTVNASLYAVPVYERFGFEATGAVEHMHGVSFLPMVLAMPDTLTLTSASDPETSPGQALDALRALLTAAGLPHADLTPQHLDHVLVLREDAALVGAVGLEVFGPDALLRSLVVAETHRGRGLGDRLTAAAEALAREEGVTTIWLLTETAAPFFAARGYAPAERATAPPSIQATAEFAALCPASAVCMRKGLEA